MPKRKDSRGQSAKIMTEASRIFRRRQQKSEISGRKATMFRDKNKSKNEKYSKIMKNCFPRMTDKFINERQGFLFEYTSCLSAIVSKELKLFMETKIWISRSLCQIFMIFFCNQAHHLARSWKKLRKFYKFSHLKSHCMHHENQFPLRSLQRANYP